MTLAEIADLPVADYAAKNAFLFLWITGPFLALSVHASIMQAWGFEPSAVAYVWMKPTRKGYEQGHLFNFLDDPKLFKMGMGKTTRQNAEFAILGRRGSPRRLSAGVRQEIIEPAREHSRKPEQFYEKVEAFCAGPRLDIFGRQRRPGWTVIGNQADKFGRAA
jgi:N6-adenosine-specific RNA methylase IME4